MLRYLGVLVCIVAKTLGNSTLSSSSLTSSTFDVSEAFPTLTVGRDNTLLFYVNASIGTPGQHQMLRVDLAQPYMWVPSGDSYEACNSTDAAYDEYSDQAGACDAETVFYTEDSSTAHVLNDNRTYRMVFPDFIYYNATAVQDIVNFTSVTGDTSPFTFEEHNNDTNISGTFAGPGLPFRKMSFFSAESSYYVNEGALGLAGKVSLTGYDSDSANFDTSFFFLEQLVQNNVINTSSFSLWLGRGEYSFYNYSSDPVINNCGSLILGGVDQSLYTGDFVKFDTLPFYDVNTLKVSYGFPIVPLTKVSVQASSGESLNLTSDSFIEPVLLDSRYTYSYLPLSLIVQVAIEINAYYVESQERWLVACGVSSLGASILFEFGNLVIKVPLDDLLDKAFDDNTNSTLRFSNGEEACFVRMFPNTMTGFNILGGPFLKNVYLAAELESNQIAMAQAKIIHLSDDSLLAASSASKTTYQTGSASQTITSGPSRSYNPSAIRSSYIPFATTNNLTDSSYLTLYESYTYSGSTTSQLVNQFTAFISSDGVIFTGRSFYETSYSGRTTTTSSSNGTVTSTVRNGANQVRPLIRKNSQGIISATVVGALFVLAVGLVASI
ncbi:LAMI_0B03752g1_1 [Lachancea mirantina]|uniref:LAMI_0B03752g1_1 n=1 Tax=Lachancea mirantina TaxID=1230905 RepID=A0A1G4IV01_9SACH|nr:LAMI_0B03752g1_1 [Lachancea mirantina]